MFVNQYNLQLTGYKMTQEITQPKPTNETLRAVDEQSKKADKQAVKVLTSQVKALRQQYTALAKDLKKLEVARMAAGNKSRRSTRPYYQQLGVLERDVVLSVDEYKSTVTCSSCFKRTSKQPHIRDGKLKRIPGAVVCYNTQCPRRLTMNATTTNRDGNGALNIALIGFSRVASTDGLPLPPFRRSQQSNKYTLSPLFPAHQPHGEEGLPTLRGDLL
ncbi:hypothetical protein MBANPS3_004817 [Mucor bainieri]